ncbi:MAG TPA: bi-domain-containing oxidoreductase [Gaiellaceae bacterium]|nr:bi-domain-containing oxidoreductase [Gaiellaceae bacterium]
MKQVLIRGGGVAVEDVPAPQASPRSVLVRVEHSCVSVGTELSSVRMSGLPLYKRALKQPHHAKRVLEIAKNEGFARTYKRVRGLLAAGLPTGYSAAGVVIEVGEEVEGFRAGDRVACAGAGIANHAELIDVPVNLAVRIPEGLGTDAASTVTLGAIALQGVRRVQPTLGETVAVVGLGILGQLAVQLLRASGARVIGSDLDATRIEKALAHGMAHGIGAGEDFPRRVHELTDGFGADAVLITAATESDEVVRQAMQACRKKGRVVLVGDVGLHLQRADMYEKELDFLISTSYGPGRYDDVYELEGQDYPIGYVRWTENRNMEEYLRLLAEGRVSLEGLGEESFPVDDADRAYEALKSGETKPLLVLLSYPVREEAATRTTRLRTLEPKPGRIGVALVGAGSFAQGQHVPNLIKLREQYELRAVMSRTGANAKAVAARAEAAYATTDLDEVLADEAVDLVLISTRHDTHAPLALCALEAGKNVFVEKPLALNEEELDAIASFYDGRDGPLLMTGFNRRFAPAAARLRELLAGRTSPLVANYRMNAGYIPLDHWVHGPEGGGRNIGEACHVYDLFDSLVGAEEVSVQAQAIGAESRHWAANDNFVATIGYADGSVCTLTYTALGHRDHPKERLDVYAGGRVLSLDDYKSLAVDGGGSGWRSTTVQKGHREELEALARALREGGPWPIPLEQQLQATRISFAVERQLRELS